MFALLLSAAFNVGDGTITIKPTEECMAEVTFDNHLAAADSYTSIKEDFLLIEIERGSNDIPDYLSVTTTWGWHEKVLVGDESIGTICVPRPLMG